MERGYIHSYIKGRKNPQRNKYINSCTWVEYFLSEDDYRQELVYDTASFLIIINYYDDAAERTTLIMRFK